MSGTPDIEILDVTKRFGDLAAVDGVRLDIAAGEFFSLLGPSGCGKTTLLRMIAGFEQPTGGAIRVAGRDVTHVPPHRRPTNMVFQHYALFPHLTVARNVAFGLRYQGLRGREADARVAEALERVQLRGYDRRRPHQLSGGQRQRVALARALVLRPRVLLLDEPLGALDQKLRREMQVELKHLQRSLGITFVFVTHDQEEALSMSDRVAVMNAGRVEQVGASRAVYEFPRTRFVAEFLGAANFFSGTVTLDGPGRPVLRSPAGFEMPLENQASSPPPVGQIRFVVRPEKLRLTRTAPPPGAPAMPVTVEDRIYQGMTTLWAVRNDLGERFTVVRQNAQHADEESYVGASGRAFASWDPRHLVVLDESSSPPPGGPGAAQETHAPERTPCSAATPATSSH